MTTQHQAEDRGIHRGVGVAAGLLIAMLSGRGHGLEEFAPPATEGRLTTRLHITVHQGWLSVELRRADVREVLARLGQEAGLAILGGPRAGTRVSA